MIRNVTICEFHEDAPASAIDDFLRAMRTVRTDGLIDISFGLDLGLRAGNGGYALVADFEDEAAYVRYDSDPEHERIRRELAPPIIRSATRVQFLIKE